MMLVLVLLGLAHQMMRIDGNMGLRLNDKQAFFPSQNAGVYRDDSAAGNDRTIQMLQEQLKNMALFPEFPNPYALSLYQDLLQGNELPKTFIDSVMSGAYGDDPHETEVRSFF